MAVVAHFVHGRGRGHASRARSIAAALAERGHRVVLFAGGDALDLLSDAGHELVAVEPVLPGASALRSLPRRLRGDLGRLRALAPALVISDGDAPSVRVGRRLGVPVLSVGHDQLFLRCRLPSGLPRGRLAYERAIAGLTSAGADAAVAVHFLPAVADDPWVRIARPEIDMSEGSCEQEAEGDGSIVAYLRDGRGGEALAAAAASGRRVLAFGRITGAPAGVEVAGFDRQAFRAALRRCAAVIATAGSNLLAECVLLKKPILALHARGDHEQRLNGLLAVDAGVAEAATIGDPAIGDAVRGFLGRVERGGFATVELAAALPPVSTATAELAEALLERER